MVKTEPGLGRIPQFGPRNVEDVTPELSMRDQMVPRTAERCQPGQKQTLRHVRAILGKQLSLTHNSLGSALKPSPNGSSDWVV